MTTIDLTTNILAPLVMGQIITFGSPLAGTVFIGAWNLISLIVEYYLLHWIYVNIPALAEKEFKKDDSEGRWNIRETMNAWKAYFNHRIRFAGIGFALLFITVMGFDSITFGRQNLAKIVG